MNFKNKLLSMLLGMICCSLTVISQSLPNVQKGGVYFAGGTKEINKTISTDKDYVAYNTLCRVWYTVANDNENLYLIIRGKGLFANEKIFRDGLTFTIRPSDKKSKKSMDGDIALTFPLFHNKTELLSVLTTQEGYRKLRSDTNTNRKKIDSLQQLLNSKYVNYLMKDIKVTGIKAVTDTLIAVYNTTGIKTVAFFDNKIQYVYKLAIPLKYLGDYINNGGEFSYNIKIDVPPDSEAGTIVGKPVPDVVAGKIMLNNSNQDDFYRFLPTDFWGSYSLAKQK